MRYKVEEGSLSGHCCFEATVIDTQEEAFGHPTWVCESFDECQAQKIAEALNRVEHPLTLGPNLDKILTICYRNDVVFALNSGITPEGYVRYEWRTEGKKGWNDSCGTYVHFADVVTDLLQWLQEREQCEATL